MQKIYIRTHAFNAQHTLRRTVDSVLNQTYEHFSYFLCDNGSTDDKATRKIIEDFSKLDNRIIPFFNKVNRVWDGNEEYLDLPLNICEEDYYCLLDADDEYLPTFFEEMIAFMNEYNLDIACCGSDFFSVAANNNLVGRRLLNENLILEGNQFADMFPFYHVYMRTVWGKLFKGSTLHNMVTRHENCPDYPVAYGGDTYVTMNAFSNARRVGILAKPLHKYYVSHESVSYAIHPQRIRCDQILHKSAIDYLKPFGEISECNYDFLYTVYLNALRDTLNLLLNAEIPISDKLNGLIEMFSCDYTRQLAARKNLGSYIGQAQNTQYLRIEVFLTAANWLLTLEEVDDEQFECFCNIGEFVCAAAELEDGWIVFKKLRIEFLINQCCADKAKVKLEELIELLPDDKEVLELYTNLKINSLSSQDVD